MKRFMQIIAMLLILFAASAGAEEELKQLKVWASDFTDQDLARTVGAGDSCAAWLKYLMSPAERYVISHVAGIQGPPGVVYTLTSKKGEVGILKCGTAGSHGEEH